MNDDPHHLNRFIVAQQAVLGDVLVELRQGEKKSHWMWFVFPQIAGLGQSAMSRKYAIASILEARAYLQDPVLGPRLIECTRLVLRHSALSATEIFGSPDDDKFHSSMTLFSIASPGATVFATALDTFFDGHPDRNTMTRVG